MWVKCVWQVSLPVPRLLHLCSRLLGPAVAPSVWSVWVLPGMSHVSTGEDLLEALKRQGQAQVRSRVTLISLIYSLSWCGGDPACSAGRAMVGWCRSGEALRGGAASRTLQEG